MEEEALAHVDAPEELPVALELGLQYAVGGDLGELLEGLVQLLRPEHREHHPLVEVAARAVDPHAVAHQRAAAVAADQVLSTDDLSPLARARHVLVYLLLAIGR